MLHVSAYSISPISMLLGVGLDNAYWFFLLGAIAYCMYMGAFYCLATTDVLKSISVFALTLYLSNLFDVLFFDRRDINWNEYLGAVVAIIITYLEYRGVDKLIKIRISNWLKRANLVEK